MLKLGFFRQILAKANTGTRLGKVLQSHIMKPPRDTEPIRTVQLHNPIRTIQLKK